MQTVYYFFFTRWDRNRWTCKGPSIYYVISRGGRWAVGLPTDNMRGGGPKKYNVIYGHKHFQK